MEILAGSINPSQILVPGTNPLFLLHVESGTIYVLMSGRHPISGPKNQSSVRSRVIAISVLIDCLVVNRLESFFSSILFSSFFFVSICLTNVYALGSLMARKI